MNEIIERRKSLRLQVTQDALVALTPHYFRVGQIVDASMGGLAYRCIAGQEPLNGSFELDIFLAGRAFYLHKVPVATIWDIKIDSDASLSSISVRQGGVQFGELTPIQISQLEYFLGNYTKT
jgi:hypothetical protein